VRILLVNEASGVQAALARGLRALGHEVVHALPHGASRQHRPADVMLGVEGSGVLAAARRMVATPLRLRRLGHFDVVHFVLGITALVSRVQRHRDLPRFRRHGALLSYTGLGCDEIALLRVRPGTPSRSPCAGCEAHDAIGGICRSEILSQRSRTGTVAGLIDVCVTPMPDYDHAASFFPSALHARIPLPVSMPAKRTPRRDGPVRLVHAPSRRGFKGTAIVLAALERLRVRGLDPNFTVLENLPHAEFLERLADADVLIDQVHSFGAGMAALEALADGKIVISGNAPEMRAYYAWGEENPIIDAVADPDRLADSIAHVLALSPAEVAEMGVAGASYVRRRHDETTIAAAHLDAWQQARLRPRVCL
jgi:hypothetical protein